MESQRKFTYLKEVGENDEPDLKAGDIGLLRLHSRDNAISERDKKGAFYTPYAIAYDIAERTLSLWLMANLMKKSCNFAYANLHWALEFSY